MRRSFKHLTALIAGCLTVGISTVAQAAPFYPYAQVNTKDTEGKLNVRTSPGIRNNLLGNRKLKNGEVVRLTPIPRKSNTDDHPWFKVNLSATTPTYVSGNYLTNIHCQGNSSIPVRIDTDDPGPQGRLNVRDDPAGKRKGFLVDGVVVRIDPLDSEKEANKMWVEIHARQLSGYVWAQKLTFDGC